MNKETLKQILEAMKLHTAETHPIVETERAMELIEAELAQEPVRREQRLFMEEQEFYESPTQRQPLTDEVHNAFLQGIRYAANKYEVVSDEIFTGGDVSNFLLMEAEELDTSDIIRAIEAAHGIKEQP